MEGIYTSCFGKLIIEIWSAPHILWLQEERAQRSCLAEISRPPVDCSASAGGSWVQQRSWNEPWTVLPLFSLRLVQMLSESLLRKRQYTGIRVEWTGRKMLHTGPRSNLMWCIGLLKHSLWTPEQKKSHWYEMHWLRKKQEKKMSMYKESHYVITKNHNWRFLQWCIQYTLGCIKYSDY